MGTRRRGISSSRGGCGRIGVLAMYPAHDELCETTGDDHEEPARDAHKLLIHQLEDERKVVHDPFAAVRCQLK